MKEYNMTVLFLNKKILPQIVNLVENDYNSTKLNFKFDIEAEKYIFKCVMPNGEPYVAEIENNSILLPKGLLTQKGTYKYQISAYGDDNRLTTIAEGELVVQNELLSTDEIIELDERIPILDNLINEVNRLDVDAEKVDNETTITITKKDNTTKEVKILDGVAGAKGEDAKINGVNTLNIIAGENVTLTQEGSILSIDSKDTIYDDTSLRNAINQINEDLGNTDSKVQEIENDIVNIQSDIEEQEQTINHLDDIKQNNLISGTNIKTINGNSILGEGNIEIQSGGSSNYNDLENKPLINDILLEGNINGRDLGILDEEDIDAIIENKGYALQKDIPTQISQLENDSQYTNKTYVDGEVEKLDNRIDEIELFKFPNAIIHGEPTINNGQISNFSQENYLSFPAIFELHDRGFEFNFAFRTGSDVSTAQNIIGSKFCMALFIQNAKLNLRVSQNGTSWDLVDIQGNIDIQPNTTYYVQIYFDKLTYKLKYSLDGQTFTDIASKVASVSPHASQIYMGVGNNFFNPFLGIINLNKCYLKVNNSIVWQGMDDAGLATRADLDLSNISSAGEERIKELAGGDSIYLGSIIEHSTAETAISLNNLKKGLYILTPSNLMSNINLYFGLNYQETISSSFISLSGAYYYSPIYIWIVQDANSELQGNNIGYVYLSYIDDNSGRYGKVRHSLLVASNNKLSIAVSNITKNPVLLENVQTITGRKTFDVLPQSSATPTTDNQLTNKKYVDDKINDAIGSINSQLAELTHLEEGE